MEAPKFKTFFLYLAALIVSCGLMGVLGELTNDRDISGMIWLVIIPALFSSFFLLLFFRYILTPRTFISYFATLCLLALLISVLAFPYGAIIPIGSDCWFCFLYFYTAILAPCVVALLIGFVNYVVVGRGNLWPIRAQNVTPGSIWAPASIEVRILNISLSLAAFLTWDYFQQCKQRVGYVNPSATYYDPSDTYCPSFVFDNTVMSGLILLATAVSIDLLIYKFVSKKVTWIISTIVAFIIVYIGLGNTNLGSVL